MIDNRGAAWAKDHVRCLKIGPEFLPTLRNFCIMFYRQGSHTEVKKRNATELRQTAGGKSR